MNSPYDTHEPIRLDISHPLDVIALIDDLARLAAELHREGLLDPGEGEDDQCE